MPRPLVLRLDLVLEDEEGGQVAVSRRMTTIGRGEEGNEEKEEEERGDTLSGSKLEGRDVSPVPGVDSCIEGSDEAAAARS